MILHIVFYQPRTSATETELGDLVSSLELASREIPSIRQVRAGRAIDLGYDYKKVSINLKLDHVAIFEFNDVSDFQAYFSHKAHAKLAELFWKTCDQTMIVDITAVDPRLDSLTEILVKQYINRL